MNNSDIQLNLNYGNGHDLKVDIQPFTKEISHDLEGDIKPLVDKIPLENDFKNVKPEKFENESSLLRTVNVLSNLKNNGDRHDEMDIGPVVLLKREELPIEGTSSAQSTLPIVIPIRKSTRNREKPDILNCPASSVKKDARKSGKRKGQENVSRAAEHTQQKTSEENSTPSVKLKKICENSDNLSVKPADALSQITAPDNMPSTTTSAFMTSGGVDRAGLLTSSPGIPASDGTKVLDVGTSIVAKKRDVGDSQETCGTTAPNGFAEVRDQDVFDLQTKFTQVITNATSAKETGSSVNEGEGGSTNHTDVSINPLDNYHFHQERVNDLNNCLDRMDEISGGSYNEYPRSSTVHPPDTKQEKVPVNGPSQAPIDSMPVAGDSSPQIPARTWSCLMVESFLKMWT